MTHIPAIFLYPQDRYQPMRHTPSLTLSVPHKRLTLLPLILVILHLGVLI